MIAQRGNVRESTGTPLGASWPLKTLRLVFLFGRILGFSSSQPPVDGMRNGWLFVCGWMALAKFRLCCLPTRAELVPGISGSGDKWEWVDAFTSLSPRVSPRSLEVFHQ
ncbi:hypothetical protein SFRURICE_010369, partial [Spodoptera frugiperda]